MRKLYKYYKYIVVIVIALHILLSEVQTVFAQTSGGGTLCLDGHGVETAIGCVPYEPNVFIGTILTYIVGFAGGIALLLMIIGAFQMITSAGNPDALKAGQERFTAAIIGLLFILFSVVLLEIIGVDILDIPGFSTDLLPPGEST